MKGWNSGPNETADVVSQRTDGVQVRRFVGGPLLTTCYAIIVPGEAALIIDAPRDAWRSAVEAATEAEAPVVGVLASHGHWDHITDLSVAQREGLPVFAHPADQALYDDPMAHGRNMPFLVQPVRITHPLSDGEWLRLGPEQLQVLHTPGHSPGSVTIWVPALEALFTGDTALKGGAGYTEEPDADPHALAASIRRLAKFPETTTIFPGHGPPTTIGAEPWLSDAETSEEMVETWQRGVNRWTPRKAKEAGDSFR
jgi:glyoxylase-like metal-dependent hydrolase (beta-lactamase superfamily II)